jgi:integrase/recombinase XerD
MSAMDAMPDEVTALRAARLVWTPALWPAKDRLAWTHGRLGKGPDGLDNPATLWRPRTLENHEDAYGRYLAWLYREGLFVEDEPVTGRVTPDRVAAYVAHLKSHVSPVSVATYVGGLASAVKSIAPETEWSWLSRRYTRLKLRARPSREKRHAVRHTLDLHRFGKELMDTADEGYGGTLSAAQRYQSGLIIALLAARPLRIRNFQAIVIGRSLRWDGKRYWLTFSAEETKTGSAIDEPLPDDLTPYLEGFLRHRRPFLLRRATRFGGDPTHRSLWVTREGEPMPERTLRDLIKRYTRERFGTAIWPHLFRHCLLTSVAIDQPDLMKISATLLGHNNHQTGEKHYNQAHMLDASRRFAETVSGLRESFLDGLRAEQGKRHR